MGDVWERNKKKKKQKSWLTWLTLSVSQPFHAELACIAAAAACISCFADCLMTAHKYTHTLYLASCTDLVICQLIERKRKRRRQLLPSVARLSFLLFLRLWLCRLVSFSLHLHWTVSCDGKWAVTDLTGQHRRRRRRWRHFKFHFLIAQPMWHDS